MKAPGLLPWGLLFGAVAWRAPEPRRLSRGGHYFVLDIIVLTGPRLRGPVFLFLFFLFFLFFSFLFRSYGAIMDLFLLCNCEVCMANAVSQAEIEKFKLERLAEREFCDKLQALVDELKAKAGVDNTVYVRMARFLKSRV